MSCLSARGGSQYDKDEDYASWKRVIFAVNQAVSDLDPQFLEPRFQKPIEWDEANARVAPGSWLDDIWSRPSSEPRKDYDYPRLSEGFPFIENFDVLTLALSGSQIRKIVTFCRGIFGDLDLDLSTCQALILVPTRDLAHLIASAMRKCWKDYPLKVHASVGGKPHSLRKDEKILSTGVHVVIGTPGRVSNLLKKRVLDTDHIRMSVLDGADEMLSGGTKDQIYEIIKHLPLRTPLALFSDTLSGEIRGFMKEFMHVPSSVLRKRNEMKEGIQTLYWNVEESKRKIRTVVSICKSLDRGHCVIYVISKSDVEWVSQNLAFCEFNVSATHRRMDQNERDVIEQEFRSGSSHILVTTDLLVRDIDLQQVSLIINYDGKDDRLCKWRGGRFGREGIAINLLTRYDKELSDDIESFYYVAVVEESSRYYPISAYQCKLMKDRMAR